MVSFAPASVPRAAAQRHSGLDWLRIAAFALLILYHISMVFAPWDWVLKSAHTYPQLIVPMAILTPWRLALLFAVSGYASAKLFDKSGDIRAFVASRNLRLGIPLAFAMLVLVPLEMWVRVRAHGYPFELGHFWLRDNWHYGVFYGVEFPSWEHLWFVVYLWAYTIVLAVLLWGVGIAAIRRWFDWLAEGQRLIWAPIAVLVMAKLALMFVVPERQGLFRDWAGHAEYLPIFLFGFALGGSSLLWPAVRRTWTLAAAIAVLAGGVVVAIELLYQGRDVPPHAVMALDRAARLAMAWGMIVLLLHIAETYWNRDHPWRATLAEAVFPFYLVHHPVIVLLAWFTLPLGLGPWSEFGLLLAGTTGACLVFYLVGRELNWLRPLIGLRARPRVVAPDVRQPA
ncbi:acyltransferase family protein [Sphingomonas sp. PB4P5]|uniref:acyltransferase family protein n=1 Tax=Parasphingomonas puruogangriensis TaxID=3096155 RepID=UPI002FC67AA9